jgi:hypothetical protein
LPSIVQENHRSRGEFVPARSFGSGGICLAKTAGTKWRRNRLALPHEFPRLESRGHDDSLRKSAIIQSCRLRVTICNTRKHSMNFTVAHIQPVVALLAGILILIMPRLLNYIVAIYLIFVGIVGLGIIR